MKIKLHIFGSKNGKCDFTNLDEQDTTKRRYHFSINTNWKEYKEMTLEKLEKLNQNKTHQEMQKPNMDVFLFCPDCISKIKQALKL